MSASAFQDLRSRLGVIASILLAAITTSASTVSAPDSVTWCNSSYSIGTETQSAPSPVTRPAPQSVTWASSSTYAVVAEAQPVPAPTSRTIQLAINEIRFARSILNVPELGKDAAFLSYVDVLNEALDAYNARASETDDSMRALVARLAVARAALEGNVSHLATWLALTAVTQPNVRYPAAPRRFLREDISAIAQAEAPSAEEVTSWLDLAALA